MIRRHFSSIIFLGILASLLSSCSSTLPQGYYFPEEDHPGIASPLMNFKSELQISTLWSAKVTDVVPTEYLRFNLASLNHTLYVDSCNGYVKAFDEQTGQLEWQKNLGIALSTGVAAAEGKVFVATDNGDVIALEASQGKVLWKRMSVASEILATPVVTNHRVFIKSIDGSLTAFSTSDGKTLWRYTQPVPSLFLHVSSNPVVYDHYVVAGFSNGHLVALNQQTGRAVWDKQIASRGNHADISTEVDTAPVVQNGIVFVGGYQGKIAALDLATGNLIWRHKISAYSGLCIDRQSLYVSDMKSYVWAFSQDVGALLWRQKNLYYRQISAPARTGRYIIVGDASGYVHWLSTNDGRFVARNYLDGSAIVTPPFIQGNSVFVYTRAGNLYKLHAL